MGFSSEVLCRGPGNGFMFARRMMPGRNRTGCPIMYVSLQASEVSIGATAGGTSWGGRRALDTRYAVEEEITRTFLEIIDAENIRSSP